MKKRHFGTLCSHEQKIRQKTVRPHVLPLYQTSSFEFEDIQEGIATFQGKNEQHFYSRYGNPTIEAVAEKIAVLETYQSDIEATGVLVSSGMAAIATLLTTILQSGDKILTQGNLYGGTTELLYKVIGRMGIGIELMDLSDETALEECLKRDKTIKVIYFETPANPSLACVDIQKVAAIGKAKGVFTVLDNTFCTPYLQQPLLLGADFVVHSTTKYLNGHGTATGGVVVGTDKEMMRGVWQTMKLFGTNASPFDAWLTSNGMKTLELRMHRHSSNALALATFLAEHEKIESVNYPGLATHPDHLIAQKQMRLFGGMLSFEVKGGLETGVRLLNNIELCTLAPTLGDTDTLILHPASMSHVNVPRDIRMKNGITDGLIRLSVGIENEEDLIADLAQALDKI